MYHSQETRKIPHDVVVVTVLSERWCCSKNWNGNLNTFWFAHRIFGTKEFLLNKQRNFEFFIFSNRLLYTTRHLPHHYFYCNSFAHLLLHFRTNYFFLRFFFWTGTARSLHLTVTIGTGTKGPSHRGTNTRCVIQNWDFPELRTHPLYLPIHIPFSIGV